MSDIRSRIVFESTGGDKVAQDIGKIKKSFDDASSAKDAFAKAGTGAGGLPSDAFGRATRPLQFPIGSTPGSRGENTGLFAGVQDRDARHRQTFSQQAQGGIQRGMNAITQAGTGDVAGGGGTLLLGLGKMGVAGIVAAAVAATTMGISKLADKDLQRSDQLWTNIGQQLGYKNFSDFNDMITGLETKGFKDTVPFMTAMAGAGASMGDIAEVRKALQLQFSGGADLGGMGRLFGAMQLTGANTSEGRQENMQMQGINAFGKAGLTEFYSAITQALETGMTKGFSRGSSFFRDMYTTAVRGIADLGLFGGMTVQGATTTYQGMVSTVMGAESGVRNAEDAYRFQMARRAGESYGDTIRRISDPKNIAETYRDLKRRSGGNRDILEQMMVSVFDGVTYNNVGDVIKSQEGRITENLLNRGFSDADRASSLGMDDTTLQRRANKQIKDAFGREIANVGGGAQSAVFGIFQGNLTPEQKASLAVSEGVLKSKEFAGRMQDVFDINAGADPTAFINKLPVGMRDWATSMYQGMDTTNPGKNMMRNNTFLMSQFMPLMSRYGEWSEDQYSVSQKENQMFTKHQALFQQVAGGIGGALPEAFSTETSLKWFENSLQASNALALDGSTIVLSILDALLALVDMGLINGYTDEGMTPSDVAP